MGARALQKKRERKSGEEKEEGKEEKTKRK
jgi:hypothetical protein